MSETNSKVIVALDYSTASQALAFVDHVSPAVCRLKVGKELFTAEGPVLVKALVAKGFDVFLDLKFHDIPNTVHNAVAAACELGVWMLNVHAMGGRDMMAAARKAVDANASEDRVKLIAVSILTSTSQQALKELGIDKSIPQAVADLTRMSLESGLDGMVCSAQEAIELRKQFGPAPLLVTPGIRPAGAATNDQHRIMTPLQAIQAGASYLVIGRPITQHSSPFEELMRINTSLQHI
ncbi:MAG: orotidine-5'-phosphate decarboxylase [Gammaproteobacteria bacterium]|nr:orotidine-5'-phosphate decarboxylase [Gammaproteobacteria bacterium]MBL7000955.1 orotidine-5'-phosphate decarboxylase [Gammaproteobacteria bacterium]